jgi:hypothetical protein
VWSETLDCTCDCGHTHETDGPALPRPGYVHGARINVNLLAQALDGLDADTVTLSVDATAGFPSVRVDAPGWIVLLMGLRPADKFSPDKNAPRWPVAVGAEVSHA